MGSRPRPQLESALYFHRIALAHRELSVDNLGRALELLEECPQGLRQWEWHYLERLCRIDPLVVHDPGKAEVNSVAFSPDGERLATAGGDGTVKVWNLKTRGVIRSRAPFVFGHNCQFTTAPGQPILVSSYHPSQQNTSTGKLTEKMLTDVFRRARRGAE